MKLKNDSGSLILCRINGKTCEIPNGECVGLDVIQHIEITDTTGNFWCDPSGKSRVLKFLSFIDDPFRFRKDCHILVNSIFDISELGDVKEASIFRKSVCCDHELQVYYDYFVIQCEDTCASLQFAPINIQVSDTDKLIVEFGRVRKKVRAWTAIWDVFLEPIIGEIIGLAAIYLLFSIWLRTAAWYIVIGLIGVGLVIDIILLLRKLSRNDSQEFASLLMLDNIFRACYK